MRLVLTQINHSNNPLQPVVPNNVLPTTRDPSHKWELPIMVTSKGNNCEKSSKGNKKEFSYNVSELASISKEVQSAIMNTNSLESILGYYYAVL